MMTVSKSLDSFVEMKKLFYFIALACLPACTDTGGFGSDWIYRASVDPISQKPTSFAMMLLPGDDFTDDPSYLTATCDENGFEFYIASEGYWGHGSHYFKDNQRFELRVGDRLFKGRYLPTAEGDSAYLISKKPKFSAVKAGELLNSFSAPTTVAVRVMDYRGTPNTVTRTISGKSENLLRVAQDCQIK